MTFYENGMNDTKAAKFKVNPLFNSSDNLSLLMGTQSDVNQSPDGANVTYLKGQNKVAITTKQNNHINSGSNTIDCGRYNSNYAYGGTSLINSHFVVQRSEAKFAKQPSWVSKMEQQIDNRVDNNPRKQFCKTFLKSSLLSTLTGLITVLIVHFVAGVKNMSDLIFLFITLSVVFVLVLNVRNLKSIVSNSFSFVCSINGNICLVLWVSALLVFGPIKQWNQVDEDQGTPLFTTSTHTEKAIRVTEEPHSLAFAGLAEQRQQHQFQHEISNVSVKFSASHTALIWKIEEVQLKCNEILSTAVNKSKLIDQRSQCSNSTEEFSNPGILSEQTWKKENKHGKQEERNDVDVFVPSDPIARILDLGKKEIQTRLNPIASHQTMSERMFNKCPCCSQHFDQLKDFCNEITDNLLSINESIRKTEDFKSEILKIYEKTLASGDINSQRGQENDFLTDAATTESVLIKMVETTSAFNKCKLLNIAGFSLILISAFLILAHVLFHKPSWENVNNVCRESLPNIYSLCTMFGLLLINLLLNFLMVCLFGDRLSLGMKNDSSQTNRFHDDHIKMMLVMLIGWLLFAVHVLVTLITCAKVALECYQQRKLSTLLARMQLDETAEKVVNNSPNRLNLNITCPSPKLSKQMNNYSSSSSNVVVFEKLQKDGADQCKASYV